jgi:hypothetical protein
VAQAEVLKGFQPVNIFGQGCGGLVIGLSWVTILIVRKMRNPSHPQISTRAEITDFRNEIIGNQFVTNY